MIPSNKSCMATFSSTEVYFMNPMTGSVDTKSNWECENLLEDCKKYLIEVTLIDGEWIEK